MNLLKKCLSGFGKVLIGALVFAMAYGIVMMLGKLVHSIGPKASLYLVVGLSIPVVCWMIGELILGSIRK
jgi:hypothetical protein